MTMLDEFSQLKINEYNFSDLSRYWACSEMSTRPAAGTSMARLLIRIFPGLIDGEWAPHEIASIERFNSS
ncbi:MAG: hypothetical protein A2428_03485 [Bdellovibrionales bacterium RIFOXYC1_FULL_54_43]|nr:MAG: hypothetical protein A2428_03485 [Bdellovibrionales bacterium RIFOXYC1_FULL_54_43]OFZ83501.1 MAG: hypothetical protein A2603_03515 [Bdellovibrionales bacterium RIFOXYD1_FULL_55_31]